MSQFIVSARKYRPQTFDTVVGQESITNTLKAAIQNNHLAQAFLFCGPRGVGKTSCARILARTINCENLSSDFSCCNTCDPCKSFNDGHSLNIYELDAASNNGVDQMRDLTLQVSIAPQIGSKKVYIIDEVHMLSTAAFNAFLKTLEEPPAYAIFILATTEKHKILPTILSRCQVFDFRRIGINDIVGHLQAIATNQGINAEPAALHAIAEKADGGMRDALSIFDQLISYSGEQLTYADVTLNLNILDHSTYFGLTDILLKGDTAEALVEFDQVLKRGFDGHHFVNGLGAHLRNLLVVKDERSASLLETSDDLRIKYMEQAARCQPEFVFRNLDKLAQCDVQYRSSKQPRLLVELALIRCCEAPRITPTPASAARVEPENTNSEEPEPSPVSVENTVTPVAPIQQSTPHPVSSEGPTVTPPAAIHFNENTVPPSSAPIVPRPTEPVAASSPAKRRGAAGVSISTFLKKEEVEETVNEEEQEKIIHAVVAIPSEDLNAAWGAFAEEKKKEGKNSLCATLIYNKPHLEGNMIHFNIVNEVQEMALREERFELLAFLRSQLNAPGLELTLAREEVGELKPRYTAKDRFRILAERNPELNTFKDKLKLDI